MLKFSNVKQRKDGCFTNETLIAIIIITLFESQIILAKHAVLIGETVNQVNQIKSNVGFWTTID